MKQIKRSYFFVAALALAGFVGLGPAQAGVIAASNLTTGASSYTTGDGLVSLDALGLGLDPAGAFGVAATFFGVQGGGNDNSVRDLDGDPATTADRQAIDITLDSTVGLSQISFMWARANGAADTNGVPSGIVISGFLADPKVSTDSGVGITYTNGAVYLNYGWDAGAIRTFYFSNGFASKGQTLRVSANDSDQANAQFSINEISYQEGVSLSALDTELKKQWPNNRTINFIFHGHSVPSGYHVTPAVKPFESYPYLFHVMLKEQYPSAVVNMINTAIGGEHSISGAARFNADVLTRQPDLIFIDYAINDRSQSLAAVETAWRSMITNATAAGVPVILLTPTGVSGEDLSNPTNALAERAELIRTIAADEGVLLADVSAAWLDVLNSGTNEASLLSQGNHPNLAGHQIAADTLWYTYATAADLSLTVHAADFPRDSSTNTFTTTDGKLTFVTSNTFSADGSVFVGDSGGAKVNSWDGAETLDITPAAGAYLTGFEIIWAVSDIVITGFNADPGASVSGGTATWNEPTKTLTLDVPWDAGVARTITFADASASAGSPLNFSFTDSSSGWQVSFTSFSYKTN